MATGSSFGGGGGVTLRGLPPLGVPVGAFDPGVRSARTPNEELLSTFALGFWPAGTTVRITLTGAAAAGPGGGSLLVRAGGSWDGADGDLLGQLSVPAGGYTSVALVASWTTPSDAAFPVKLTGSGAGVGGYVRVAYPLITAY